MITGKMQARQIAGSKITALMELKGKQQDIALDSTIKWLEALSRGRREAAIDVFVEKTQLDESLIYKLLDRAIENHLDDLKHILHNEAHGSWPGSGSDAGLHFAWYYLTQKKQTLDSLPGFDARRSNLASCLEIVSELIDAKKMTFSDIGLTAKELGQLWKWNLSQWNEQQPGVLQVPVRSMINSFQTLMKLDCLDAPKDTMTNPDLHLLKTVLHENAQDYAIKNTAVDIGMFEQHLEKRFQEPLRRKTP